MATANSDPVTHGPPSQPLPTAISPPVFPTILDSAFTSYRTSWSGVSSGPSQSFKSVACRFFIVSTGKKSRDLWMEPPPVPNVLDPPPPVPTVPRVDGGPQSQPSLKKPQLPPVLPPVPPPPPPFATIPMTTKTPPIVLVQTAENESAKMPVFDLTKKPGEPFVVCKVPLDIYNRVVKMMQDDKNPAKEQHIKGSWTEEEDRVLVDLVKKYGAKRWTFLATNLKGRVGKQCRERYLNHLDPGINKSEWTEDEDDAIVRLQRLFGNKWAKIAKDLAGRTPNMIKNRWNSTLKKRYATPSPHLNSNPEAMSVGSPLPSVPQTTVLTPLSGVLGVSVVPPPHPDNSVNAVSARGLPPPPPLVPMPMPVPPPPPQQPDQ